MEAELKINYFGFATLLSRDHAELSTFTSILVPGPAVAGAGEQVKRWRGRVKSFSVAEARGVITSTEDQTDLLVRKQKQVHSRTSTAYLFTLSFHREGKSPFSWSRNLKKSKVIIFNDNKSKTFEHLHKLG